MKAKMLIPLNRLRMWKSVRLWVGLTNAYSRARNFRPIYFFRFPSIFQFTKQKLPHELSPSPSMMAAYIAHRGDYARVPAETTYNATEWQKTECEGTGRNTDRERGDTKKTIVMFAVYKLCPGTLFIHHTVHTQQQQKLPKWSEIKKINLCDFLPSFVVVHSAAAQYTIVNYKIYLNISK